jgi:RNase H-fold protein (predicted Holliday junction resolvase)
VHICKQEVNSLTSDDLVILWGGSNDVAKNETKNGLSHLKKIISRNKNMNFILITAPHRFDLMESSCVNEEIKIFNRKMHKIMKLQSNVRILDIVLDRSCFTRQGLHLNGIGKNRMKEMIVKQISELSTEVKGDVIALGWPYNMKELY